MTEFTTHHSLFKSLVKDGCVWHGDILSHKWGECLYFSPEVKDRVMQTLSMFTEGVDYKLEDGAVWF